MGSAMSNRHKNMNMFTMCNNLIMRDTNSDMVRIYGGEKVNELFFGLISIMLNNEEVKLRFGTDKQGYFALIRTIQFSTF